jgi:hypothetical protein
MSTLRVTTLQNLSGTEVYTAKAWVNFNGTGTVAIRAAGNVSSITDNGTGDYTVNFTVAMSDANYATTLGARRSAGNFDNRVTTQSLTTSGVRLSSVDAGGTAVDFDIIQVAIFR